jgi:hypothetical protein
MHCRATSPPVYHAWYVANLRADLTPAQLETALKSDDDKYYIDRHSDPLRCSDRREEGSHIHVSIKISMFFLRNRELYWLGNIITILLQSLQNTGRGTITPNRAMSRPFRKLSKFMSYPITLSVVVRQLHFLTNDIVAIVSRKRKVHLDLSSPVSCRGLDPLELGITLELAKSIPSIVSYGRDHASSNLPNKLTPQH